MLYSVHLVSEKNMMSIANSNNKYSCNGNICKRQKVEPSSWTYDDSDEECGPNKWLQVFGDQNCGKHVFISVQ